ncbi:MAG: 1-acyl-sn-glycerol-3-phosphate acyltransferase [Candidatus Peribacteraceae bacterium]|nr:1-acyl-sn-glycerol-3-phosphate acyltransferase [Candidatus Peribacteraceae bacterium]
MDASEILLRNERIETDVSNKINQKLESNLGVKIKVEGIENIPTRTSVFALRHESPWETIGMQGVFAKLLGRSAPKFVAKEDLFKIWFLGSGLRNLHHIPFRRHNRSPADTAEFNQAAKNVLHELERDLIIFIEGTRMLRGVMYTQEEYKKAAVLARLGAPVVPGFVRSYQLGQDDIFKELSPKNRLITRGSEIIIRFGKPMGFREIREGGLDDFFVKNIWELELGPGEDIVRKKHEKNKTREKKDS